ncbi:radical SAM family heme chaperone HemW [Bdellovibrionota bacterium FG-2]
MGFQSLYVHLPFCESKCSYCDFYSLGKSDTKSGDQVKFLNALFQESQNVSSLLAPELNTIFFGGGTPSLIAPEAIAKALGPLGLQRRITDKTEFTIEANPSSITPENLRELRTLGVNRLSLGIQSLDAQKLKALGRVHTPETALKALDAVFASGIENVSVDLLCGVPGQTPDEIRSTIKRLTQFPITHLSCYLLTLHKTHPMFAHLPDEDLQLNHLLAVDGEMRAQGFEHYEISNFARPGRRARHNLVYWTGGSYLGLGPSAHSYDAQAKKRWKNISSLHKYCELLQNQTSCIEWSETLTPEQLRLEQWMLGLRLDLGVPRAWLTSPNQISKAEALTVNGLLEIHPANSERIRLTPKGLALSDQVIAQLAL